jgi:hypothetical protein
MIETHTHIFKTEFVTSFFDVSMSDFDIQSLAGVMYCDTTRPSFAVWDTKNKSLPSYLHWFEFFDSHHGQRDRRVEMGSAKLKN